MKVWEHIRAIKGISATHEQIQRWMVSNKICPNEVSDELREGKQPELDELARKLCNSKSNDECTPACYKEFLMLDMPEQEATHD